MMVDKLSEDGKQKLEAALDRCLDHFVTQDAQGKTYTVEDLLPDAETDEATRELRKRFAFTILSAFHTEILQDYDLSREMSSLGDLLYEEYTQQRLEDKSTNGSGDS